MPLDAREVVGILSTFQNMRMNKESAARAGETYGKQAAEYEAGADPEAMGFDEATKTRLAAGGAPKAILDRPFTHTQTHVAQEDELGKDLDAYKSSVDLYDAAVQRAEAEGFQNPEMAKTAAALKQGREYFRKSQEEFLMHKRARRKRAAASSPVEEAITSSKQAAFPFGGKGGSSGKGSNPGAAAQRQGPSAVAPALGR